MPKFDRPLADLGGKPTAGRIHLAEAISYPHRRRKADGCCAKKRAPKRENSEVE
ncbi:hypothetical protein J3P71_02450 [Rhizobium leguminosarum]|nr:hypothetical protein [Rhizobium leguminosarum]QSZ08663.1 hypothetical protein J3P71_02450 [Rhizobium leguminosarum]